MTTVPGLDSGDVRSGVQADFRVGTAAELLGLGAGGVALVSGADLLHVGDLGGLDGHDVCQGKGQLGYQIHGRSDNPPP